MKLLTITVPCYNSQDYMEKCVESLVVGGDEVEILVVDDGSVDRTAEIALSSPFSRTAGKGPEMASQNLQDGPQGARTVRLDAGPGQQGQADGRGSGRRHGPGKGTSARMGELHPRPLEAASDLAARWIPRQAAKR